jgi:ribosomal protein L32
MSENQQFYVYAYLRSQDSFCGLKWSPYYIGKGHKGRAFKHHGRRCPAPRDKSYIVFVQEGLTEQEALKLEQYCIALYGRIDIGTGILHNLTDGGEGASGMKHGEQAKQKVSQARRGKRLSMEHRLKLSQSHNGKTLSRDHKLNIGRKSLRHLYEFIDLSGEVYITENASDFCRQHGLDDGSMSKVIHGKRNCHKGWTGRIVETLQ